MQTWFHALINSIAAMFFAGSVIAQNTPIKEYSSDNRLMNNITTARILTNGMVLHAWQWNETAKALDEKYGLPIEDGGHYAAGLIAQDVQAKYPDAVIEDENGYLRIDLPILAEQDELIAEMVMGGEASTVATYNPKHLVHRPHETVGTLLAKIYHQSCFTVGFFGSCANECHYKAKEAIGGRTPNNRFLKDKQQSVRNSFKRQCSGKYGRCPNNHDRRIANNWIDRATWHDYLVEIRYIQWVPGRACYYYKAGSSSGRAGYYNWLYPR